MLREHLSKTHSGLHVKGTCGGDSDDVIIAGALEDRVVNAGVLLRTYNAVPNKRADAGACIQAGGMHSAAEHALAPQNRQRQVSPLFAQHGAPPPAPSRYRATAPSRR